MGGNSLLEIVSLGRLAGQNAFENLSIPTTIADKSQLEEDREYIEGLFEEYPWEINFYDIQNELGAKLYRYAGIVRDNNQLNNLLNELRVIKASLDNMGIGDKSRENNSNLVDFLQFINSLEIGEILLDSAIVRDESRGAHYKKEFPKEIDKLYKAHSTYWIEDGVLQNKLIKIGD